MSGAIASLAFEFQAGAADFRILPAGRFRSNDGRPANLPAWYIDSTIAAKVIAAAAMAQEEIVIDYEHQTLKAEANGQPAPAAGWFKQMEWREGIGLFALNPRWTERAKAMLRNGEYRYISPVFRFSLQTGEVLRLHSVALTNTPALSGLIDLQTVAVNRAGLVPQGIQRDSERSVEAFNAAFGQSGVFHPESTPAQLQACRESSEPASVSQTVFKNDPRGEEAFRRAFPTVRVG